MNKIKYLAEGEVVMELIDREEIKNEKPIGTHFKKENIVLATVVLNNEVLYKELKMQLPADLADVSDEFLRILVEQGIIQKAHFDIFYKDENGYTYFYDESPITIKGDDSDGNGTIEKIVSVWDYYKEDELFEAEFKDAPIIIATTQEPLMQYNSDYNTEENKRKTR